MRFYLSSPCNRLDLHLLNHFDVLISFTTYIKLIYQYASTFNRILIDSGAYSKLNSGTIVDVIAYKDWAYQWINRADAIAGLDDIEGDYKKSYQNFLKIDFSFPTWHDTDPIEYLDDLIELSKTRTKWIAIGLLPPREGKEYIIKKALERIPNDFHIHGWALYRYKYLNVNGKVFGSFDSTNWLLDSFQIQKQLPWLTHGESLEIVLKRYRRIENKIYDDELRKQVQLANCIGRLNKKDLCKMFNLTEKDLYHIIGDKIN